MVQHKALYFVHWVYLLPFIFEQRKESNMKDWDRRQNWLSLRDANQTLAPTEIIRVPEHRRIYDREKLREKEVQTIIENLRSYVCLNCNVTTHNDKAFRIGRKKLSSNSYYYVNIWDGRAHHETAQHNLLRAGSSICTPYTLSHTDRQQKEYMVTRLNGYKWSGL